MQTIPQRYEESQDISVLIEHPRNPRRGNVSEVRASFRANGFYGTVIAQVSTNYILVGHTRVKAANLEDMDTIPVMWIDVDDETATRILLADNRTSDIAQYDDSELLSVLREFDMGGLEGTGWTDYDIDQLEKIVNAMDPVPPIEDEPQQEDLPPPLVPDKLVDVLKSVCPNCGTVVA